MKKHTYPDHIYGEYAPQYEARGFHALPVKRGTKKPEVHGWNLHDLSAATRQSWHRVFADSNIGLLAGSKLPTGRLFGFVDVDDQRLVPFVSAVLPAVSAKVGAKGRTIFCQVAAGLTNAKLRLPGAKAPAVEIFVDAGQTVVPPSIHPHGHRYRWEGVSLLDLDDYGALPTLDPEWLSIIKHVVRSKHALEIVEGGSAIRAHQAMLSLTSSGIAKLSEDLDRLATCLNALFHPEYSGDTPAKTREMLESAKRKGLGRKGYSSSYDPGQAGPVPLGFTKDGNFAFRDRARNIILIASANQLLSFQYLLGIAPSDFWTRQFPSEKGLFSATGAGEMLIRAAKGAGPFSPLRVRGRGIWREGGRIIVNLGGAIPPDAKHHYVCFDPIAFTAAEQFDAQRLLAFLQRFHWRNPQDAMLLLGWFALAPICGVLNWRPHCFLYGPPRCGKTTIHSLAARLLHPLVISADGQSSEAGIRQTLGADSLPVIIDEFESDHHGAGLRGVLRLARSASSADTMVLKGTPEGKAMQFSLRTSFFFCAVNPGRMSPADQTRMLFLEMLKHDSDPEVARQIIQEETHFRDLGPLWCGYMLSLAHMLDPAIDIFAPLIPSADSRHRQNFSTILAGAFVVLHGRLPSEDEAAAWVNEYSPTIERHAQEIERDNSVEALEYLLAHVVDDYPLSHWIATALLDLPRDNLRSYDELRITRMFDIVVRKSGDDAGILIRNGSPTIERVFRDTPWEGRGWERALRGLEGAFSVRNPIYFSGSAKKSRCIGIPAIYIPHRISPHVEEAKY